jgi:hypothetical protein
MSPASETRKEYYVSCRGICKKPEQKSLENKKGRLRGLPGGKKSK